MKKDKSRDPNDHIYEILHTKVAGTDIKRAILDLMNINKNTMQYHEPLEYCNISSIHKKGKKSIYDNYRGVLRVTVLRNILDGIIYNNIYPDIEAYLGCANVGCRKIWNIVNAVINSVY